MSEKACYRKSPLLCFLQDIHCMYPVICLIGPGTCYFDFLIAEIQMWIIGCISVVRKEAKFAHGPSASNVLEDCTCSLRRTGALETHVRAAPVCNIFHFPDCILFHEIHCIMSAKFLCPFQSIIITINRYDIPVSGAGKHRCILFKRQDSTHHYVLRSILLSDEGDLGELPPLPALLRACKIQKKVAKVGFDWPDMAPVADKVREEWQEFREALAQGDAEARENELGDLLFALVNYGRHAGIEPETALNGTNNRFTRRFRHVEDRVHESGRDWQDFSLDELDAFWEEAKREEVGQA